MSPFSVSDGHDFPWLIEEVVPGVAAMVDDIVVGALSREYPLNAAGGTECHQPTGIPVVTLRGWS